MSLRKFIKIFLVSFFTLTFALVGFMAYEINKYRPTVAESILDSVVVVENSSGIVVYQDFEYSLVLTAAHVIASAEQPYVVKMFSINEEGKVEMMEYEVEDFVADPKLDLALLKIPALDETIIPAQITKYGEDPREGDDIFIGANPHFHYRSLKKGILSSKLRISDQGVSSWEVDAMIIFGSSGGGVFTSDGKLFGVVRGVDALQTDHCWGIIDMEKQDAGVDCLSIPMTEIGYIIPPRVVRGFISSSKFADYFDL